MMNISAVILAGGKSRRFGSPKALVKINGQSIIDLLTTEIGKLGISEIVISSNNAEWFAESDMHVCADHYDDCGPLAGIHSAMKFVNSDILLVVACDIPGVKAEHFARLIDEMNEKPDVEICFASTSSGDHPLCALVRKSMFDSIENALDQRRLKVLDVYIERTSSRVVFDDETSFANLNSPEDLVRWGPES